jgi:hypothetical protein
MPCAGREHATILYSSYFSSYTEPSRWKLVSLLEGAIDGTVSGDVFAFRLTSRPTDGEMTVNGDEMTGYINAGSRVAISLRRLDSSSLPRSQ